MRARRSAVASILALLLLVGAPAACGEQRSAAARSPLVSYREEGGLRFRLTRVTVLADRRATVEAGGRTTHLHLGPTLWKRLRTALRRADVRALAGDYPPLPGSADEITTVIAVGRSTVRIAPAPTPANERVRRALGGLVSVLRQIVLAGERL